MFRPHLFLALITPALVAPVHAAPKADPTTPVTQTRERYGKDTWLMRHEQILARHKTVKPEVVFIGDSITHFWAGDPAAHLVRGGEAWKLLTGDRIATNLGFGFDYVENAHWRVLHGELDGIAPKVIVVLLGTNNLGHKGEAPADTARGMAALLGRIREKQPAAHILLLGVLPRREPHLAAPIAEANRRYAQLAGGRVTFVDVGDALAVAPADAKGERLAAPALFSDVVHPNAAGYAVLAKAIRPHLDALAAKP